MIETPWLPALLVSIIVPWALGTAIVAQLLSNTVHRNVWLITGHGYLAGMVFTTLIIRSIDIIGISPGLAAIIATQVTLVSGLTFTLARTWHPAPALGHRDQTPEVCWKSIAFFLLLALAGLRLFTITQEAMLRPLFAWDAWMNWAPKASIFYHAGELVQFVSHEQWLVQPTGASQYTLGNAKAWNDPITVPLIQYWGMVSLGDPNTPLAYLSWPMISVALGLALFGHLRLAGLQPLLSMLACYTLLSLPYLNIHTALVGYADIWLATAFGFGVLSLHAWQQHQITPYAALAIAYASACVTLKLPGVVTGSILLACFILAALRPSPKLLLLLLAAALVAIAFILSFGISVDLPLVGKISLAADKIQLPLLGEFELAFHPVQGTFGETLFLSINWHLLWPTFLLATVTTIAMRNTNRADLTVLVSILLLLFFLLFVFFLTRYHSAATSFHTLNRALLYATPAMVFYIFLRVQSSVIQAAIHDQGAGNA